MSLLGPDDFDLDRKGRAKKLAQDLSPALRKQIEKWLDEKDEELARRKLTDLVGPEEAQRLMDIRHRKRRR
ncbi:MAG: hypothetical protein ACTSPE_00980 [Candidatus Thorarchaeota archaeon]